MSQEQGAEVEIIREIENSQSPSQIYELVSEAGRKLGMVRQAAHLTPRSQEPNSPAVTVFTWGFDEEWLALYETAEFRLKDPIPARTLRHGTMLKWADAILLEPNTPENEEYFEAMRSFGLIHGAGLPLFGPDNRNTYAAFDFGRPIEEVDDNILIKARAMIQLAHQRMAVLSRDACHKPKLSNREFEVLELIARGKSVRAIAISLNVSQDSIKTYVKRLYEKLKVGDRVGLVLTAAKHGLIRY